MKTSDLMLGNYVNFKGREDINYCEVNEISIDGGTHIVRHFKDGYEDDQPEAIKDLTPIPLIEDWIIKCNLRRGKLGGLYIGITGIPEYIKHVHELQNWFYWHFNKKELTIK